MTIGLLAIVLVFYTGFLTADVAIDGLHHSEPRRLLPIARAIILTAIVMGIAYAIDGRT